MSDNIKKHNPKETKQLLKKYPDLKVLTLRDQLVKMSQFTSDKSQTDCAMDELIDIVHSPEFILNLIDELIDLISVNQQTTLRSMIIKDKFLRQKSNTEIQIDLCLTKSTFYRELNAGLSKLAEIVPDFVYDYFAA